MNQQPETAGESKKPIEPKTLCLTIGMLFDSQSRRVVMPPDQRNFEWETKKTVRLIDMALEVETTKEGLHQRSLAGASAWIDPINGSMEHRFSVADGQQRLTALTIILMGLIYENNRRIKLNIGARKGISDPSLQLLQNPLEAEGLYRDTRPKEGGTVLKIELRPHDQRALMEIVDMLDATRDEIGQAANHSTVWASFIAVIDHLADKPLQDIYQGLRKLQIHFSVFEPINGEQGGRGLHTEAALDHARALNEAQTQFTQANIGWIVKLRRFKVDEKRAEALRNNKWEQLMELTDRNPDQLEAMEMAWISVKLERTDVNEINYQSLLQLVMNQYRDLETLLADEHKFAMAWRAVRSPLGKFKGVPNEGDADLRAQRREISRADVDGGTFNGEQRQRGGDHEGLTLLKQAYPLMAQLRMEVTAGSLSATAYMQHVRILCCYFTARMLARETSGSSLRHLLAYAADPSRRTPADLINHLTSGDDAVAWPQPWKIRTLTVRTPLEMPRNARHWILLQVERARQSKIEKKTSDSIKGTLQVNQIVLPAADQAWQANFEPGADTKGELHALRQFLGNSYLAQRGNGGSSPAQRTAELQRQAKLGLRIPAKALEFMKEHGGWNAAATQAQTAWLIEELTKLYPSAEELLADPSLISGGLGEETKEASKAPVNELQRALSRCTETARTSYAEALSQAKKLKLKVNEQGSQATLLKGKMKIATLKPSSARDSIELRLAPDLGPLGERAGGALDLRSIQGSRSGMRTKATLRSKADASRAAKLLRTTMELVNA